MTESLYIRLSGPLQSWAGPAVSGNIVRTERYPTRSGLIGLLASALGAQRGEWPDWLNDVEFMVREDRRPIITDDFHTINPRTESVEFRSRYLIVQGNPASKACGKKALVFTPDAQGGTSVVNRTYLADGEFVVRITADGHLDELEDALSSPGFVTYLGRKAFAPEFPFYLGRGSSEAMNNLPVVAIALKNNRGDEVSRPVTTVLYGPYHPEKGRRQQIAIPVVADRDTQLSVIANQLDIRRPL